MTDDWGSVQPGPGMSAGSVLPLPLATDAPYLRPGGLAEALAAIAARAPQPWHHQLRHEPAVLAAEIVAFRPDDALAAFDLAAESGATPLVRHVRALAQQLQDWMTRARSQLPEVFADTLDTLDAEMNLQGRVSRLATSRAADTRAVLFEASSALGLAEAPTKGPRNPILEARRLRGGLVAAHHQMVHAVASLQPAAQAALRARLDSGRVDPAIGLLVAELTAAGVVEARLNRFTRRHTEFYFAGMLGQHPAPAQPERVLLHIPPGAAAHLLPQGARLIARSAAAAPAEFRTLLAAPVTTARVAATGAITWQTDPQVSAHATLGAITRVVASLDPPDRAIDRGIFTARLAQAPNLGLDVSSDMFRLHEGRREIEVRLEMRRASALPATATTPDTDAPRKGADPEVLLELARDPELVLAFGHASVEAGAALIAAEVAARPGPPSMALIYQTLAERAPEGHALRLLLGRIVTLGLVEGAPWPSGRFWQVLGARIDACRDDLSGQRTGNGHGARNSILAECFAQDAAGRFLFRPEDVFQTFFADTFDVTLSGAAGPIRPEVRQVLPNGPGQPPGLTLRLSIGPEQPPITAEGDAAPRLTIRYGSATRICPVSFFERYQIARIGLRVRVAGLRRFAAFNDDGPVAADQSFLPFGSRPADGATLTIAAPEMAVKPVSRVTIALDWADLPVGPGGFAAHYAQYPPGTAVPDPQVTASLLSAEGWAPLLPGATALVDRAGPDGRLASHWQRHGAVERPSRPDTGADSLSLPRSRGELRAGAVRLTLSGVGEGLGQVPYTMALAQAMRPRLLPIGPAARPRALPNPPWLPRVAALRLGYEAADTILLSDHEAARPRDRVRQVTPFGTIGLFPERIGRRIGLFPARLGYGTLFVQLAGPAAKDRLSLLFDIADSGHERTVPDRVPLVWHYLTDTGWQVLPATAITSDTTDGLLRPGTMVLDLPDDASETAPDMPPGGVWLAVSAERPGFETYPVLSSVRTNGIWASGVSVVAAEGAQGPRAWRFDPGFPGLGTPVEVGRRLPPRPPETPPAWRARVAARLRHRARAVTPWDVECLVLDAFPEVWHVKCLPHLTHAGPAPAPGRATVVLVRHPPPPDPDGSVPPQERHFDVSKLTRVRDHLERHASPFAGFEVVNPAFDRIQVRAQVRFGRESQDSARAHRLRQHLVRQLSVWTAAPDLARLGWSLNVAQLRAQIAALDYVQEISDFSVLHFASDDRGIHRLIDTARGAGGMQVIRPSRPWALPLSAADHAIEASDLPPAQEARPTGIGRLRVGDMLIVGQEAGR